MRFLFVKSELGWPRTYGHDVHGFGMMQALAALGHEVALATDVAATTRATDGLTLAATWTLSDVNAPRAAHVPLSALQERYRRYWGIDHERIETVSALVGNWKPDVLVVVGLEILPYLAASSAPVRVWYAADEWVWHYLSQIPTAPGEAAAHLKAAAIKGLYERAYGSLMDRVWVVSKTERRAMRFVSGCRHVDVIPNGVDVDTFRSLPVESQAHSVVFWGRLGFGPNLQGLRWFVRRVWPLVIERQPGASCAILGSDPPAEVAALDGQSGLRVIPNLPDLRQDISRSPVAVLPFVSGGGIKNKLLEAAAMGRAIVGTPRAMSGLRSKLPAVVATSPREFADGILRLWADPAEAARLGADARRWVVEHHSWRAAALEAVAAINDVRRQTPHLR